MARQHTRPQSNRDDFSPAVKRRLAERVSFCCSNPNCQKPTSGPSSDPLGAVNIGVASHITAAAPGGPRYDLRLTHEERQSANNGIWLCQNCGKLVDNDERGYPASLLYSWKASAETRARNSIESPYYPLQQATGSAALVVLSEKVDVLANWTADEIENDLNKMREELREGHKRQARQWLERVKTNKSVWDVLKPTVKAKTLRFETRLILDSQNEIERAKELLAEADSLAPSEESQRLRAFIAFREGVPETGVEIIGSQEDIDSLNLKAALLLNLGRVDDGLTVLEQATQVDSSSAETFRLRALAFLLQKELGQAQSAIERALELKPRWQTVQYVSAVIHYWSALSPAILPNSFVPWPAPVDWAFIKSDDSSRAHLQKAATLFHELMNAPEQREEERKYLEGWYLACLANDSQKQEEAVMFCRNALKQDPTHYPCITWVTARGMDVSLKASEHALEQRFVANSVTVSDVLALVQCFLAKGHVKKALRVLQRARPLFVKQQAMWVHWYAQANIFAGNPERALAALDKETNRSEQNKTRTLVLGALANKSGDWRSYLEHLDRSFSETRDPVFLLECCGVKARLGDWAYVADRATDLVTAIRTAEVARLSAFAAFNTRRFPLCLQILETSRDLFPQQKLSVELRRLRIHSQYALGALPQAVSEAETLAREEPTLANLMSLAEICFDKGDLKRLALVAQQINQRPDLSVEWALHLAHMLLWEDAKLARTLWRRANESGIPDEFVSTALDLGFRLGLDDEMRVLMQRMQALGGAGRGGIERKRFEDLLDFFKQRHEHLSELEKLYRKAEIPIHLFAYQLNQSLAFFHHQLLATNARELTPLRQPPLLIRHGGRVLAMRFPEHPPKWRLHLDVTALLCAEYFGILDAVEKTFSPLRIPSSLPRALARMREQLMPHQPSKFVEYEQIADLANRGTLKIAQPISPLESEKQFVDELGEDWIALYELARSRNGYIVDFLPLTKKGSTVSASALPLNAKAYLVNCRSIVDALRQQGPLSEEGYARALEQLGEQARVVNGQSVPPMGAQLYCVGNIPEVFAGANLLSMVCEHFEVYIEQRESQAVNGALAFRREQEATAQWVDSLVQRVQVGIERGTYEIIPITLENENDPEQISLNNPELDCLLTLLRCETREGDCLWIDDRFANRYLHRDGIPIVGINEIMKSLVGVQAITQQQFYQIIHAQRASNVRFVPLQEDEILHHLRQAHVENGRLSETAELGVMRRYVAACILSSDLINTQPPSNQDHGTLGEIDFLIGLERAIIQALVELWQDDADDVTLQARSDWILSNLYLDHLGVFSAASFERPNQDSRYLAAITLAALANHAVVLDWRSPQGALSKRRKYFEWLYHRLLSQRFDNEPTIIATVAEILKRILVSSGEEVQKDGTAQIIMLFMQRFYNDLPERLQRELSQDTDFMTEIGLTPVTTVTVGNLNIDVDQFYGEATAAVNGQSAEVTPLRSETPIKLRASPDPNERNVIYTENPTNHDQIRIVSDELILLRESVLERETILRQHQEWFDCSQDIFERALAEIVTTPAPVERIRKLSTWQQASAAVYYLETERKLSLHQGINIDEFLPPSSEGLLRHFRLNVDIGAEQAFRDGLEVATERLIHGEGLWATIERMMGLPVAIPENAINAVTRLDPSQKRNLLKQLLVRATSPVARIHLIRLLILSANDVSGGTRLARWITMDLLSDDDIDCFEAFFAVLHWVHSEFEHRAGFASWSPQLRLAMAWAHAEKLSSLCIKYNISPKWIRETFTKLNLRIPTNLFGGDSTESHDITHPRHVDRVSFLLMGLAYALGDNAEIVITPAIQVRCLQSAFTYYERVRLPETSLAIDPTQANNLTASFLGRERSRSVLPFLGEELSKEFSSQEIEQLIERRLTSTTGEGRLVTWFLLFSALRGLPPYASITKPLKTFVCETPFADLYQKNPQWGMLAILTASWQMNHIGDLQVHDHIKNELLKIAELLGTALVSEKRLSPRNSSDLSLTDEILGFIMETARNISVYGKTPEEAIVAFKDFTMQLITLCPPFATFIRSIILQLYIALPAIQGRHLADLLAQVRAR